jgi:glycerate kinase
MNKCILIPDSFKGSMRSSKICSIMGKVIARYHPNAEIIAMCDIDNPLCGPDGAAHVFAPPKKGADPAMVALLDSGLVHMAAVVKRDLGVDIRDLPGAGAAGGMGGGKVVIVVARRTKSAGVPLVALVGDIADNLESVYDAGVSAIFSINRVAVPFSEAKHRSRRDLACTMDDLMRYAAIFPVT